MNFEMTTFENSKKAFREYSKAAMAALDTVLAAIQRDAILAEDIIARIDRILREFKVVPDLWINRKRAMIEARTDELNRHYIRTMNTVQTAGFWRRMLHPKSGYMARAGKRLKS